MIRCTGLPFAAVDADMLVVPWFEDEGAAAVPGIDAASGGDVARALDAREFAGRSYDIFTTHVTDPAWQVRRLLIVGAGKRSRFGSDIARRLAVAVGLWTRQRRVARAAFVMRADAPGGPATAEMAQAIAEGLTLAEFDGASHKTRDHEVTPPPLWTIVAAAAGGPAPEAVDAISRGRVLGECSNLARGLANEPGNTLTPREFARRAAAVASEAGVSVEILDEAEIARLGMGLLIGVAQGSEEPPRMIVFRHDPPGAPATPVLGLVGKGVTFDTGGISIKPADGMERMKDDMAGGAAVACAMRAIALLKAPIRVIGVVPATENMPSGRAIKPGDVLTSASGKTVEIINTDAEGRLILGDGLWYARQLGATHLVDVATLTGAVVVALGRSTSGLFGTPPEFVEQVRRVADRAGDRAWPMPIFEDYREQLKSEIADFTNTGGRPAGSITAALFIGEFTDGLPWVHMDIAGTAWVDDPKPYLPKGASGVAVRTLAELAFSDFDVPR
ncbi:MAG: leucyl aminopeptidase [Acidobacteriota bacterium]